MKWELDRALNSFGSENLQVLRVFFWGGVVGKGVEEKQKTGKGKRYI